jgi:hypothetical protein
MIDPEVPEVTALVLAALLVLAIATLLGHAIRQRSHARRLAQPLADARKTVTQAVDGRATVEAAVTAARALPFDCRITVLADLAPTLRGLQRERLEGVAREAGVLAAAAGWAESRRWWRRLQAARLHTLLGGGEGAIEVLLRDPSWEVRAEAAQWGALHPTDAVVEQLLAMLADPRPLPRFAAKDALRRIGRPLISPLIDLLGRASGSEAAAALEVATAVATPAILPAAVRLSHDELAETRARSAVLLGVLGGEAAIGTLLALLHDPDPAPRAAAADALGRLGHWPAVAELTGRLRDQEWEVRRNAALALRSLGSPGLLLLRRALADDDRFAADVARQVLDLPDAAEEVVVP